MERGLVALMSVPLVLAGSMLLAPKLVYGQKSDVRENFIIDGNPSCLYAPSLGQEEILSTEPLELQAHHITETFLWENTHGPKASFNHTFLNFPRYGNPDSAMGLEMVAGLPNYDNQTIKITVALRGQKGNYTDYTTINLGSPALWGICPQGMNLRIAEVSYVTIEQREGIVVRKSSKNQNLEALAEIEEDAGQYTNKLARELVNVPKTIFSIITDYIVNLVEGAWIEEMEKRFGVKYGSIGINNLCPNPVRSVGEYYNVIAISWTLKWIVSEADIPRFPYAFYLIVTPKRTISWIPWSEEEIGVGAEGDITVIPPRE